MKYSEDIKMEIAGKFINGNYTDNLKLIYKDLNRLTKSAISEQLTLNDVSQQRELLKSFCKYIDLESIANPDDIEVDIENHLKVFNCG